MYIVSTDRVFADMLLLLLADNGIQAVYSKTLPKRSAEAVIDLDTVNAPEREDMKIITFSREARKSPDFLRPFPIDVFVQLCAKRFGKADREQQDKSSLALSGSSVYFCGEKIDLTDTEFRLLKLLYERKNTVVPRETITSEIWGTSAEGNVADVYINYLRRKTDMKFGTRMIQTVRGKGYMLRIGTEAL